MRYRVRYTRPGFPFEYFVAVVSKADMEWMARDGRLVDAAPIGGE